MKRTIIYLTSILLLTSASLVYAGTPGESPVTPFEISISARQTGLGEAFTAYYDCNSLLYNPASLALLDLEYITATHNRWITDASQSYFGMGFPFSWGFLAGGLIYFNEGEILERQNWIIGDLLSNYTIGLITGYGGNFHRYVSAGVNLKVLYRDYSGYTASAFAADVGAICPNVELPYGIGNLNVGLVVQNIGPKERLHYVGFNQPMTPKLGIAVEFPEVSVFNFNLLADASYPIFDNGFRANVGLEIWAWKQIALRAGYRIGYDVSKSALTLGAGLKYKSFNFDYAMVNYDYVGLTHRFTVCMGLSEMKPVGPLRVLDRKLDEINVTLNQVQGDVTDLKLSVDEVKDLIKSSLRTSIDLFYIRHYLNVLFPFDSYKVTRSEYWKIDEAVRLINVYYPDQTIVLEGHTDIAGTDPYNQTLSERRSQAVKDYMIAKGIPSDRIVIAGKGETSPLNDETGPGTRGRENRRVIFVVSE